MTSSQEPCADDDDDFEEPVDPERARREQRDFRFRHLLAHLHSARDWKRSFELVEQRGFLADQTDWFGGFQQAGEDVEKHVLPAAIDTRDWERFTHFAAVAANFRALAEDLVDPDVLRALAVGGRDTLALDLAGRIANPLARAAACAVIASAWGQGHPGFGELLRSIAQDVQTDDAEVEAERRDPLPSLISIARRLGPELDTLWPVCIPRLAPVLEDAALIWQSVGAAWLDRGNAEAPGLWHALAKIGNPVLLLETAPKRLAELAPDNPWKTLERLGPLLSDNDDARRWAFATFLGRLAQTRPESALATWEHWTRSAEVPWSAALIESCRDLMARLDSDQIEELCARIRDPDARVALRVVDLEAHSDEIRAASALAVLQEATDGGLHWSLRYVASQPPEPEEDLRRKVDVIASFLYEMRYEAPSRDLRLFLDLVARYRPNELKAHLEGVIWSPASKPEMLLTLASETECVTVAELLLENAERYAAAVAPTAVDGFQLRKELLIGVTGKLCSLRESTHDLERAVGRLLPEEEDDLRSVLAQQLKSRPIAEGIRDRRRRLLALLETTPPEETGNDLLAARSLYSSIARIDSVEDEIRGLSTLLEHPLDLSDLADKRIGAIRDPGIRLQALLRLAWHSLAFQESFYGGRPDRTAAIEMVRSAFTADTDALLVAAMPQVARLGAQAGGSRAVAELQEASRRLMHIDSVPWARRLEALERILASLPSIFLTSGMRRGAKKAAEVLEAVARLPFQSGAGTAQQEIQERWHEILPMAAAALDQLPEKPSVQVRRAFRLVLTHPMPQIAKNIFELCALPPHERLARIDHRLGEPDVHAEEIRAFAYLLAIPAPERVRAALDRLPVDAERDSLALRLIRNDWLPPKQMLALQSLFSTPEALQSAEVWLISEPDAWCRALAALAERGEIDPASAEDEPLIRRLWERSSPEMLPSLALAVQKALRTGGRQRGEAALRLWLHALLAPKLGTAAADRARQAESSSAFLRQALELAPAPVLGD